MIRYITIIILTMLLSGILHAQEVLTGLEVNPTIRQAIKEKHKPALKNDIQLTLPFFDDFSGNRVFPAPDRWANNDVFINNDYPVFPLTSGVATFDALDENGMLHPNAVDNRFRADYLTSHPIRLDSVFFPELKALNIADSVYLSFYFQPEGLGFAPAESDSLVLEFFHDHPVDSLQRWVKVWSAPGMSLNAFFALHQTYFKGIMIPIKDTACFKPGFRFRFYNIASIRFPNAPSHQSNRDHWHVDYVYLNYNRSINDIYYPDVAFAGRPGGFLKNYQSMPYRQYKQNYVNEMRDSVRMRINNLSNTTVNAPYRYVVNKTQGDHLHTYQGGTLSFQSLKDTILWPIVNFVFPVNDGSSASYDITHILQPPANFTASKNDTLRYRQVFADYYAYDDGTAEAGFGLTNPGLMAYRFRLNTPDTLARVNIFFNRTINNANQRFFHLQVWNDIGGKPGDLIYEQLFLRVEYGDGLNSFHTYIIDEPVYIDNTRFPGLTFYVGLEQTTTDILNIGFDRNNNYKQNIFYFYSGDWFNTMFDGSLMMRPVFGTTGISGITPIVSDNIPFQVFPNPLNNGMLNLMIDEGWIGTSNYQVFNLTGMKLLEGNTVRRIDVSPLPAGMYLLRIIKEEQTGTTRFVVNR